MKVKLLCIFLKEFDSNNIKKVGGAILFANHSALKEKYQTVPQKELLQNLSTKRPGRGDTCHLTDFFQTFTVCEGLQVIQEYRVVGTSGSSLGYKGPPQ